MKIFAMASSGVFLLLVSVGLFTATADFGDNCRSHFSSSLQFIDEQECKFFELCCGTCDNRYCCSNPSKHLTNDQQEICDLYNIPSDSIISINGVVLGVIFLAAVIIFIVSCLCCPCCCLYHMCRKPRTVSGAQVVTVMNTQYVQQQPVIPGDQCSGYQPVPNQPTYAAQPLQTGQYLGQTNAPGAPPPYHMSGNPAYDGGQAAYPMFAQPGAAQTSTHPTYNPACAKTGY